MAATVTDYTLVTGSSDTELIQAVRGRIADGWRPIGSPIATLNQANKSVLIQAMIR
jgi:hypothetical protein